MSAINFRVENQKALRLAECASVPRLMIICGSNGSGKSTLLWALKQRQGLGLDPANTQILYQGPHRAIRRQSIQRRWLSGSLGSYADSLSADSVAAPEGIQIPYPSRSPDNIDESGSTIKHSLAKLENRRQAYIAAKHDAAVKAGENFLDLSTVKNIFEPLGDIVQRLLPHLDFEKIDFTQEDNVRVAFERKSNGQPAISLDLDELSSGEKGVVLLFLPLVEAEILNNLEYFSNTVDGLEVAPTPDRLILLDEPELHLHPDLQRRMLAYMRERSSRDNIQFIMITHSPTILDEASDEELYVLAPASLEENQLRKAATPAERLDALRELTGESYFLSTGRNIVCVEGEAGPVRGKASDRSLIELFSARSSRYTFIPMGGKSQVITAVRRLRDSLPIDSYGVAVVGLIDSDQVDSTPDGCTAWPFCEIENALLQPQIIASALLELDSTSTITAANVDTLIREGAEEIKDDEIRLRLQRELGAKTFRPSGVDAPTVLASLAEFVGQLEAAYDATKVKSVAEDARKEVETQLADGSYVRRFRGKRLLRHVYNGLELKNLGFERFSYLLASHVREEEGVASELDAVFSRLDSQVDEQLATILVPTEPVTLDTESESASTEEA